MKNNPYTGFLCWLTILLAVCCLPLKAGHYYYKQISLKEGLPSTVRCVYTEPKGFVWIGTNAGLGRFDGEKLKKYIHRKEDAHSLPHNYIHQIIEDNQHNIWVLTDDGIAQYCRQSDDFTTPQDEQGHSILAYSACLTEQGVIFGGRNRIYRYDYENRSVKLLLDFSSDPYFAISAISRWDEETLLCCSRWQGLRLINLRSGERRLPPFDCGKEIMALLIDSHNRIWVAPYNEGLRCFSPEGRLLASYTTANSRLSNNVVLSIAERDSHIWVGTDGGGINIIRPDNHQITVLEHIPGDNYSLPVNSILSLYNDTYNNMWAGSIRKGLINIREVSMKTYTDVFPGSSKGLSDPAVLSLYQDESDGRIWIGTDGGGINSLAPDTEEFRHDRSTWRDKVVSIAGFTRETLLLSVFSKGLFVYNKANGEQQLLTIDHPRLKQYLYYSGMPVNVYQDEPGSVLLLAGHIYRYDTDSQKIRVVNEEEGMEIAGSMNAIAHNERFTYLNDSRTLYELDRTNNCLKRLFSCTGDTLLYSVSMDEKGDFWIGSNTGLGQYTPSTNRYHPLPTSLFGEVSSVICDHRGKVWIGADHMLFAWMLQSRKFILFGESDGVIPNEYLAKPRLVSGKGEVYMGGANGLLCIDNRFSTAPSDYPEVELTDVYINGEPAINQITGQPEKLTLPQDSRTITLRIMSHEQDIFRKKRYRYQIEGLNDEPIESYDPELIIRSLPAGKYRILAACSTKNGDWTPFRPILSLTILPPWYRSGWFIICVLLIASGAIAAVILTILRRRQNRLKWELKERELQEYEEKIRFLVNVSNELLPSFTETGERELQIVELIRNRLRNGEKNKTDTDIKNIPKEEKSELSQPDETFLRKLNRLITDHLDSPELDVTFLCTEMGLSRASLYNKLKAMTNMGANDYINKFRMEKAIQLISTTDLTFTEIAEKIGFTTSRYFSTSFKQYTGETPTQYKEKIRKKQ